MSGEYEDIIHLLHHVSSKRPPMPMSDRAARFSPFAALTGYDDVIRETGRLTEQKIQLDEEALAILDEKFHVLQEHLDEYPEIQFIYFKPDEPKVGKKTYITASGIVKKIQGYERKLILEDGSVVLIDDILKTESPIFNWPVVWKGNQG